MNQNICYGMVYGAIAAGIIGFVLGRIRETRTKMGQMKRSLDHFPDADQPTMTSLGVVKNSLFSMVGCVFWMLVLIVVIIMIFVGAFQLAK